LVPEQVEISRGTINLITWLDTEEIRVTGFPQTSMFNPSAELMGNPWPVIVIYWPPNMLVWLGEVVKTFIGMV